jgi:hypothetical protein
MELQETLKMTASFSEGVGEKARSLYAENEEPIGVRFLKSGWNYGYPTYHVIIEYGDMEQTDYLFMSADQIKESFDFDITTEQLVHSVLVSRETILNLPNDAQLGIEVRKQSNNI